MKRSTFLALCVGTLLLHTKGAHAQEILSFEAGGLEACSTAIHMPVPGNASTPNEQKNFSLGCTERDLAIEKTRFDSLRKSVEERSPEERVAYNALIVSFTAYLDARTASAGCKTGTVCEVISKNDRAVISRDFLVMAEGFAKNGFPSFTEDDLAKEDEALNAAYQAKFSSLPESCLASDPVAGCEAQDGLRDVERAWIRYRDAWIRFGTLRWPQVTPTSWLTYLTRQRTKQLPGLAPEPLLHKS